MRPLDASPRTSVECDNVRFVALRGLCDARLREVRFVSSKPRRCATGRLRATLSVMGNIASSVIVIALDEAYDMAETWYGSNLRTTLVSLSLEELKYDRTYEGYSAWELALHCAYWKWHVRRLLTGETDAFPYTPDDFPRVRTTSSSEDDWSKDLAYLDDQHRRLREAVAALSDEHLSAPSQSPDGVDQDGSVARMVMSIALHDAYHTAQIRNMGLPQLVEKKR